MTATIVEKIKEKMLVQAPLASADRFIHAFFDGHRVAEGAGAHVTLDLHDLQHPTTVSFGPAHRAADMTPRFDVHWEAEGSGLYPAFDGFLTVGGDEDYDTFWLRLEGQYKPPFGVAGRVFDAIRGHRIAREMAHGLLAKMRVEIEMQLNAEESKKHAIGD